MKLLDRHRSIKSLRGEVAWSGRRGDHSRLRHTNPCSAGHPSVGLIQGPEIYRVVGRCKLDDPFLSSALGSQHVAPMMYRNQTARPPADTKHLSGSLRLIADGRSIILHVRLGANWPSASIKQPQALAWNQRSGVAGRFILDGLGYVEGADCQACLYRSFANLAPT